MNTHARISIFGTQSESVRIELNIERIYTEYTPEMVRAQGDQNPPANAGIQSD